MQDMGTFYPSGYDSATVEHEFRALLTTARLRVTDLEIRPPDHDRYLGGAERPRLWHHDNYGGLTDRHFLMVVWASKIPTDIRDSRHTVILTEPFHVYRFDNGDYEHRVPLSAKLNDGRWFARAYVREMP